MLRHISGKADYFSDHSLYNNLVANFMSPENEIRLNLLRSAPLNSWIALSNDESRIVAVGKSFVEVSEASDKAGCDDPLILKTPPEWLPLSL
jgi:hypothetical protein